MPIFSDCILNNPVYEEFLRCGFTTPGISEVWISPFFTNATNRVAVNGNGEVVDLQSAYYFRAIRHSDLDGFTGFYEEEFSKDQNGYVGNLTIDIVAYAGNRRTMMDIVSRGKWLIVFRDNNNQYWLTAVKYGATAQVKGGTGIKGSGKNGYNVVFSFVQDIPALKIYSATNTFPLPAPDCSDLDNALALTNSFFITNYQDCIIGEITPIQTF